VDPKLVRNAKGASTEKGRDLLDAIVDRTVESINKSSPPR
jgi:creatinine amidohydrolase/Fe(II)-dependent formamide hydrolase-like protein